MGAVIIAGLCSECHDRLTGQRRDRQPLARSSYGRGRQFSIAPFIADACHLIIYSCRFCSTRSTTTRGAVHMVAKSSLHRTPGGHSHHV